MLRLSCVVQSPTCKKLTTDDEVKRLGPKGEGADEPNKRRGESASINTVTRRRRLE